MITIFWTTFIFRLFIKARPLTLYASFFLFVSALRSIPSKSFDGRDIRHRFPSDSIVLKIRMRLLLPTFLFSTFISVNKLHRNDRRWFSNFFHLSGIFQIFKSRSFPSSTRSHFFLAFFTVFVLKFSSSLLYICFVNSLICANPLLFAALESWFIIDVNCVTCKLSHKSYNLLFKNIIFTTAAHTSDFICAFRSWKITTNIQRRKRGISK